MQKIIIDTDPGIDDAMAILFAANHSQIQLLGLTSIHGNVPIELASENALKICEIANLDIPVCQGEASALAGMPKSYPAFVHGEDGLGNINYPPATKKLDPRHAVDFIAEVVEEHAGEITLVPIGPLTNIAKFAEKYPNLIPKVKDVVLMGGAAFHAGNATAVAEANIYSDPKAAQIVFKSNLKVTMVGLDVTNKTIVTEEDFKTITTKNKHFGDFLEKIARHYISFYINVNNLHGCCMHDVCAVAYTIAPEIFTVDEVKINVATEGFMRGFTAVLPKTHRRLNDEWHEHPIQSYTSDIEIGKMCQLFIDTLSN